MPTYSYRLIRGISRSTEHAETDGDKEKLLL
jgi:hypothetical protein